MVKILQIWTYDSRHRIKVELDDILMMSSFNNVPATYPCISMQSLLTAKPNNNVFNELQIQLFMNVVRPLTVADDVSEYHISSRILYRSQINEY